MQRTWTGLKPSATARVSVSLPFSIVNSLLSRTAPCCMFYKSAYKDRSVANRNFFKKKSIFSSKPSRRKVLNKLPANETDSSHQSPTTWAFLCDFFFFYVLLAASPSLYCWCVNVYKWPNPPHRFHCCFSPFNSITIWFLPCFLEVPSDNRISVLLKTLIMRRLFPSPVLTFTSVYLT